MTHFVGFRLLAEVSWRVYWNCFLQGLRIVLTEEKFFRTKKCSFKDFRFSSQKSLDFRQTKLAGIQKFWSISPRKILRKTMLLRRKILSSFSIFARKTLTLPKKVWLRSPNSILKVQGIVFRHISWCSITHFVSYRLLAEIFWRV